MPIKLLLLASAGALGTLARYGSSQLVKRFANDAFPWHTLVVNAAGCFLFGLVVHLSAARGESDGWHPETRLIVLAGFMGAFTTFSTFAFETQDLLGDSQYALAALNIFAQNTVGIAFVFLGLFAGRLFV